MKMLARAQLRHHSNILAGIDYQVLMNEILNSESVHDLVHCRDAIDTIIARSLRKFIPDQTLYEHCLDSFEGGRRLKPLLVLLGITIQDRTIDAKSVIGATAMEYFTSATVIIDDMIDNDTIRGQRGTPSIHAKYDVGEASLIASIMSKITVTILAEYFPEAVLYYMKLYGRIASAEYARSYKCVRENPPSETRYFDLIIGINALAYQACFQLASLCTGRSKAFRRRFGKIGLPIGIAEQLGDDFQDFLKDFKQGHRTLPALLVKDRYPEQELTEEFVKSILADQHIHRSIKAEVNDYIQHHINDAYKNLNLLYPLDKPLSPIQQRSKERLVDVIEHMQRKWEGNMITRAGKIKV